MDEEESPIFQDILFNSSTMMFNFNQDDLSSIDFTDMNCEYHKH